VTVVVLAASWLCAAALLMALRPLSTVFTPGWLVWLLGLGSLLLALTTSTAAIAVVSVYMPQSTGAIGVFVALSAVVAFGLARCGVHCYHMARSFHASRVFRRQVRGEGDVLVVADDIPEAFAVPGRPGGVVVTTALRDALTPAELAAVIRHERAHLRGRHHLFIQFAELAICLNPLLYRVRPAVRFAAERHADECAAQPDRHSTARAVAKAALLRARAGSAPAGMLGIAGASCDAIQRVQALHRPTPRQRGGVAAAAVTVLVVLVLDLGVMADLIQDRITPESNESVPALLR